MKVKVNTIAMLTMMTVGFTTVATSCSNDDVPASYQPSVLAKSLEGEWIVEQHIDGIEGLGKMAENIYIPEDADQFAILYHFNNDGTGWKELDLLKNGKVESILISRYDSQFVYTVSNEGKVSLNYTDADGKMNGQKAELLFDGKILTDKAGELALPEEFLKRFLKLRREQDNKENTEVTDEEAQSMFKQLRWQLVKDHIAQELGVKVEKEDIDTAAFIFAQQQLSQYGIYNAPEDLVKQQAERYMQDERAFEMIQEHAIDNKFFAAVREAVKVNEKSISVEDFRKLYEKDEK